MANKENDSNEKNENPESFLYPLGKYYGKFTPENLVFNANLQEFGQRVSYLCNLETSGRISAKEAYNQIKELWHQLKKSKKELLDNSRLDDEELPDL
ncbi:MAG: hypothetical protein AB4426_08775 [Xenococcaceae cyanobacterium]